MKVSEVEFLNRKLERHRIFRFPRHWQLVTSVIRRNDRTHVAEIKMNRCGDIAKVKAEEYT